MQAFKIKMRCCRPIVFQEAVSNGHKRGHGLKFQSVLFPDGMLGHLFGPVEGRRHDTSVLEYSGLLDMLQTHVPEYYVFGDQGYPMHASSISPSRGHNRTPTVCAATENFARANSKMYLVAGFLSNLHNCFHPNQVSQYFDIQPISV